MNGRRALWVWAFVACLAGVLVLALVPAPPPVFSTGWDKSNHVLAFSVLTFLGGQAFAPRWVRTLAGLLALGALIEVLQSFTPTRSADWADLLADVVGIVLGCVLVLVWRKISAFLEKLARPHVVSDAARPDPW